MSLDDKLSEFSSLSVRWLQEKLQSVCHTDAKLKSWTIKIIGDKMGFMAQVLKVTLDWDKNVHDLPNSVVVKIPNIGKAEKAWEGSGAQDDDKKAEQSKTIITRMHGNECSAYEWLCSRKSFIPFPRIFYTHGDFTDPKLPPVIVMEDLTQYEHFDIISGFNRKQLLEICDAIAAIHVRTITEPDDQWMEKMRFDNPDMAKNFLEMLNGMGGMLKHIRPDMFNTNIDKILDNHFKDEKMGHLDGLIKSKKIFPILAHGDLWSTNLLWDGDKLMSVIDWQLAHPSSVAEDLLRVLVTCVPVNLRRELTQELLAHYYAKLTEMLAAEHRVPPFSFAELEEAYRLTLPLTAGMTIFAAAMWLNSPVVEGPDKPHRIEEILQRTKAVLDDTLALDEQ